MGDRREVRGVGLEHEASGGTISSGLGYDLSIFKSHDPGEGNEASEGKDFFGLVERRREAVEDGADVFMERAVNFKGIIEAGASGLVAGVDDEVEPVFDGELKMTAEKIALAGMVGFLGPAFGGGVEVVEPGLADGCDFRMIKMWGEERFEVVSRFVNIAGMDPEAGMDFGMFDREIEVTFEIVFTGGEGNHAIDSMLFGV